VGEWGVLKTTAIQEGRFEDIHNKRLPKELGSRPILEVKKGDILLTSAGPRARCGVAALVRSTRSHLMISGKIYRFRPANELLLAEYLEYFLISGETKKAIDRMKTGISDSGLNLTQKRFFELAVPIAPLPEQKRIVDELDRRLSHLDAAIRGLVQGLRRIAVARTSIINAAMTGSVASPATGAVPATLMEKAIADVDELPDLPEGWCWIHLNDLLAEPLRNGRSAPTRHDGGGVRTFTITAVTKRDFGLHNTKLAEGIAEELGDLFVKDEDIFVQRSNTPDLVGSAAIYRGEDGVAIFPDLLIRVRPHDAARPAWVELGLRWERTRSYLRSVASGLSGSMPKIDQGKLANVALPLPPVATQDLVLAEVERRLSLVDATERTIEANLRSAEQLRRALLAAAFSGKLVPQDANDEPAEGLLARIREQREAKAAAKKPQKKSPRTTSAAKKKEPSK
jgi:type I restriction enzyme S subunit